jgi:hypothetical protein
MKYKNQNFVLGLKFSQNVKNKIEKLGIFCNNSLFSLKKITRFWVIYLEKKLDTFGV